jgi:hypothetical protein
MTGLGATPSALGRTTLAQSASVGSNHYTLTPQRTFFGDLFASLIQPLLPLLDRASAESIDEP